jgi:regulatory protein
MRKFGALPSTPAERARQLRFMAGRGFTAETVHRVLKEEPDQESPD